MSIEWSVGIDVAAGRGDPRVAKFEDRIGDLLDVLHEHAAVTSGARNGRRYGARFCVTGENPVSAVGEALRVFREAAERVGLPPWPAVEVQLQTMAELERQNRLPTLPEMVGVSEVAELLGVTRQRASALARSPSFPHPIVELKSGPIWDRGAVDRFVETWARRPGRSPAAARRGANARRMVVATSPKGE